MRTSTRQQPSHHRGIVDGGCDPGRRGHRDGSDGLAVVTVAEVSAAAKRRLGCCHVSIVRQTEWERSIRPDGSAVRGRGEPAPWLCLWVTWERQPDADTDWTLLGRRRTWPELLRLAETAKPSTA
jgi:hypothetical protein